jgi:aminoglycoside phosphotransferase family enzyme/predicted kinase
MLNVHPASPAITGVHMVTKYAGRTRRSVRGLRSSKPVLLRWSRMDAALQRSCTYPHPAGSIRRIETHISVVYLVGRYAYKIKKPVNLGFVDFTGLEDRHRYCCDEQRLNRRLARPLYVNVTAIVRNGRTCKVGATGLPIDYAVKMRRFDEQDVFSSSLASGKLSFALIDRAALRLAEFHRRLGTKPPPHRAYGSFALLRAQVDAALASLDREVGAIVPELVRTWCAKEMMRLASHFEARRTQGYVRECHGDLHLGNIVRQGNDVLIFDCIEFSEELRWIDVANDLGFLLMDLQAHGRDDLAARLLNRSLELTGDFAGLAAMRFYIVYRALVRTLVALLKTRGSPVADRLKHAGCYLALSARTVQAPRPYLLLCHGYSGSGKSVASEALATLIGAVRICSDVERKRVHMFEPGDPRSRPATDYAPRAIDAHYDKLQALTDCVLQAGYPALVDASFLNHEHRARFIALARSYSIPVLILDFHASPACLQARVKHRAAGAYQPSDADETVLATQFESADPLTVEETALAVRFETAIPLAAFRQTHYWRLLLNRLVDERS